MSVHINIVTKANPNEVNLSAHETHEQSQINLGIDLTQQPLGPSELCIMKEQKETQMLEQQRNAMYNTPMRPVKKTNKAELYPQHAKCVPTECEANGAATNGAAAEL
jgi:hypothetical protein